MIVTPKKAISNSNILRTKNKKIVLAGGCFDILHIGHIKFLEGAKNHGDSLFVLLESDENVAKLKGYGRPINSQTDRAEILNSLRFIDYVVLLGQMKKDKDYDELIEGIKPDVIAITKDSAQEIHSKRQAKKIGATVTPVVDNIQDKSTSKLAKIISEKFSE